MPSLEELNRLDETELQDRLRACCGSMKWVELMMKAQPWSSVDQLYATSTATFQALDQQDWLEAFSHHPKIGEKSIDDSKAGAKTWAREEQSLVQSEKGKVREELHRLNVEYEKKFGFVFLIFATGKDAEKILAEIKRRVVLNREDEIQNASKEQMKITALRLEKLLS